ncbi:hypothetical protein STFR1_50082 [Bacillus vallismortis]
MTNTQASITIFISFLKNLKEGIGTFYESYPTHTRYIPAYCARRRHGD